MNFKKQYEQRILILLFLLCLDCLFQRKNLQNRDKSGFLLFNMKYLCHAKKSFYEKKG